MVPTYFQDIFNNPEKSQRLQYMFAAFRDIIPYFSRSVHIETKEFLKIYSNEVNNALKVVCITIQYVFFVKAVLSNWQIIL